jgi:hypothetical protein
VQTMSAKIVVRPRRFPNCDVHRSARIDRSTRLHVAALDAHGTAGADAPVSILDWSASPVDFMA